jgi:hypothetical protein
MQLLTQIVGRARMLGAEPGANCGNDSAIFGDRSLDTTPEQRKANTIPNSTSPWDERHRTEAYEKIHTRINTHMCNTTRRRTKTDWHQVNKFLREKMTPLLLMLYVWSTEGNYGSKASTTCVSAVRLHRFSEGAPIDAAICTTLLESSMLSMEAREVPSPCFV